MQKKWNADNIHWKMLTSIEFVCTASPASTTLPIMNSFSHSVIIKNAKVFPITGLRVHLFSFKWDQKHSNTFMFARDTNSFKSNLEKRNIATFFRWQVQDTWPCTWTCINYMTNSNAQEMAFNTLHLQENNSCAVWGTQMCVNRGNMASVSWSHQRLFKALDLTHPEEITMHTIQYIRLFPFDEQQILHLFRNIKLQPL